MGLAKQKINRDLEPTNGCRVCQYCPSERIECSKGHCIDHCTCNPKPAEGWTYLYNSPKWHYFRGGRSLCKHWMTFGRDFECGNDKSPEGRGGRGRSDLGDETVSWSYYGGNIAEFRKCKSCVKALEKERAKAASKQLKTQA